MEKRSPAERKNEALPTYPSNIDIQRPIADDKAAAADDVNIEDEDDVDDVWVKMFGDDMDEEKDEPENKLQVSRHCGTSALAQRCLQDVMRSMPLQVCCAVWKMMSYSPKISLSTWLPFRWAVPMKGEAGISTHIGTTENRLRSGPSFCQPLHKDSRCPSTTCL